LTRFRTTTLALLIAVAGCDSNTRALIVPQSDYSIEITPGDTTLSLGHVASLRAVVRNRAGVEVDTPVVWTSSNPLIVAATPDGAIRATGIGAPTAITAFVGASNARVMVSVSTDACPTKTIRIGETRVDTIAIGTACVFDDYRVAPWLLSVPREMVVYIKVRSTAFDPYVALSDRRDRSVGGDNVRLDGTNVFYRGRLAAGTYAVRVGTDVPGTAGEYHMEVSEGPSNDKCLAWEPLPLGVEGHGSFDDDDCWYVSGRRFDYWVFEVPPGGVRSVFMTASGSEVGSATVNDTTDVALDDQQFTQLEPGRYLFTIISRDSTARGKYSVSVRLSGSDACLSPVPLVIGTPVNGTLSDADCRSLTDLRTDRYTFTTATPTAVAFAMTSAAFDPFLTITDPVGTMVASARSLNGTRDARVTAQLAPGTYTVSAGTTTRTLGAYQLTTSSAAVSTGLNLTIDGFHLTQATQDYAGTIPIVAGRDAILRVFARASQTNAARAAVRARVYHGTTLKALYQTFAGAARTPTAIVPNDVQGSWNFRVPGALVQPGMRVLVDVDPGNSIAESNETDNTYPASGDAGTVDVRALPPTAVTLVPVRYAENGATGALSAANAESYLGLARRLWALAGIDVRVREPFTSAAPTVQAEGGHWLDILIEIDALRLLEDPSRYYYGALKLPYYYGINGLGATPGRSAIGTDLAGLAPRVYAHELGHNFGRVHAPCAIGGDSRYPYPGGGIGVLGFDVASDETFPPTTPDIMGYCNDPWVSDVAYRTTLEHILAGGTTIQSPPVEGVLLWGSVTDSAMHLEPALAVKASPALPRPGPFHIEALDPTGAVLWASSFAATTLEEPFRASTFAFVVPRSLLDHTRAATYRVSRGSLAATRQRTTGSTGAGASLVTEPARVSTGVSGRRTLDWDARAYPLALIRSAATGAIVGFARNGSMAIPGGTGDVDVSLSDGVRTITRRLQVPR
jgi:hypothetical protein